MNTYKERQLTNVILGGALAKRFGERWSLAVSSPAEAIHAININTRGAFNRYLINEGRNRYYKIALQKRDKVIYTSEIKNRSGNSDIYILPTVKGSNSGGAKIAIGIGIVALAIFAPEIVAAFGTAGTAATATTAATGGTLGLAAGGSSFVAGSIGAYASAVLFAMGTSLILGGISQVLAPHQTQQGELNSNPFVGTIAAATQGGSVNLCYGKALVSPTPISIWFNNVDYNTTSNSYQGAVDSAGLEGGGTQYTSAGSDAVNGGTGG